MIVGTAGHIDHGKTTLVRALTGIDTDRLPEEKRRGISIALGFAPLELPGVGTVGVVDVPGHEAFVRTMVAGASGIDVGLLAVAADDGVMPQTREHVEVLRLLGVPRLVVALTKRDRADDALVALVRDEVRDVLGPTPFADAPLIPVSAPHGLGLDVLRDALADAVKSGVARERSDLFRLPVDRVFSVAGTGTVVTGTAWSGTIAVGDAIRILPRGTVARVRGIETHGVQQTVSTPGTRVAVALAGVDRAGAGVGSVLVEAGSPWRVSAVLRADVTLLPDAPSIRGRTSLRLHHGTSECAARVLVSGGALSPGGARPARLVLDTALALRAGDRFVLRAGSPLRTVGGGVVTDPWPPRPRAKPWPAAGAEPAQRLGWMLDEAGGRGLDVAALPLRLGVRPEELEAVIATRAASTRIGDRIVGTALVESLRERLLAAVDAVHREQPLAQGLDRQTARLLLSPDAALADAVLAMVEGAGHVEAVGRALRRPGFVPGASRGDADRLAALRAALVTAGTEPPSVDELRARFGPDVPALLQLLARDGSAVPVSIERWFAAEAVRTLLARLKAATQPNTEYTPSSLREVLGISRKFLIPFLEWCDRRGISRRSDAGRRFPAVPDNP